eukprot:GHVU01010634.1.p1 GENE.GHVU01010634.1~~GHVU01010634.1.p1  ORF type:complete len:702 (-),score=117.46 GHVU01010634.1:1555-3660(-)
MEGTEEQPVVFEEKGKIEEPEQEWGSRWQFIFCCIGNAVGLGNVWRFPYLCYNYGGGAFFVPYLGALFFIGIPLLSAEACTAQVWRMASIPQMHKINRRFVGVGVAAVASSAVIVAYYTLIICWVLIYFANSFKNPQPWYADEPTLNSCYTATDSAGCADIKACTWVNPNNTAGYSLGCHPWPVSKASHIFNEYCNIGDAVHVQTFSGFIFLCEFIIWTIVFLMLAFGAKVLGYIMYFTMTFPTIVIIVMMGICVTLPGANIGLTQYLGKWNGEILSQKPLVWSEAAGQLFFSVGIGNATMASYAAYNKRNNPAAQDAVIVSCFDTLYSIVAGFSVFSIAGYLANNAEVELSELALSGSSLVFKTMPAGLVELGYPGPQIILVLFFATLAMLGLDTCCAFTEPVIYWMSATDCGKKIKRIAVVAIVCVIGLVFGVVFAMDFGQILMDEIDHFVNNIGLLLNGLIESIAFAWVLESQCVIDKVGAAAHYTLGGIYLGGVFLFSFIAFMETKYGYIHGPVLCCVFALLGLLIAYFCCSKTTKDGETLSNKDKAWWLYLGNVETTRNYLNSICANGWKWYTLAPLSILWSVFIKFLVPPLLIVLVGNTAFQRAGWVRTAPLWTTIVGGIIVGLLLILPIFMAACYPPAVEWMIPNTLLPSLYPEHDYDLQMRRAQLEDAILAEKEMDELERKMGESEKMLAVGE